MESPGGYQLIGRTLSIWNTYGNLKNFTPDKPWLLDMFDQVRFYEVTKDEIVKYRDMFSKGEFALDVKNEAFNVNDYNSFVNSIRDDIKQMKTTQKEYQNVQLSLDKEILNELNKSMTHIQTCCHYLANMIINGPKFGNMLYLFLKDHDNLDFPLNKIRNLLTYNEEFIIQDTHNNKSYKIKFMDIKENIINNESYYNVKFLINGQTYIETILSDNNTPYINNNETTPLSSHVHPELDPNSIYASMPGKILEINYKENDHIMTGDVVGIMSAMKMEIPIVSHVTGTITGIHVNIQDNFGVNDLLFKIKAT